MNTDEKVIFDQSLNKMKTALYSEGYREGLSSGKDLKFQQGFDIGYKKGFEAGYALGLHNGILRYLKSDASALENSLKGQLSTVEEVDKTSRGLCVICSQEKAYRQIVDSTENNKETWKVSEIKEMQDKVISDKRSQIMTEDYSLVLNSIGLDSFVE